MGINLQAGATVYQTMITNFGKTVSHTPVTKTTSNLTGDETLTDGTAVNITGAFFVQEDVWSQQNPGLMQGADAVLLVLPSVTISKDDKITYDSNDYRVDKVRTRSMGTVEFYKVARLFLI